MTTLKLLFWRRPQPMSNHLSQNPLLQEIRQLIDEAKHRTAIAVNAEITLLYWQIGHRIHTEILQGQRAEYGKQIITTLAQQLTQTYGRGWSERQLNYCILIAQVFPDREILHTLSAQLSWSRIKILIDINFKKSITSRLKLRHNNRTVNEQ
jgi:hypothetical protein